MPYTKLRHRLGADEIRIAMRPRRRRRWAWYRCKPLVGLAVGAWFGICYWIGVLWFSP